MEASTNHLKSSISIFKQYKGLAEKAIAQLNDEQLFWKPEPESNSIYLIIKHLSGNMQSRWTDFLTTDGEKEWRNRDEEFIDDKHPQREEVMTIWNNGWICLFAALEALTPNDLSKIVKIRTENHSVMEAINRQLAHYSYHIGQVVFLAKIMSSENWQTLSIAKNKSKAFNKEMMK